ncbi:MAG: hypothetical protein EVA58_05675, partial [Kiritimatiellaceae bacterium]
MKKSNCILITVITATTAAFANFTAASDLTFSTNSNNEIVITGFAPSASIRDLRIPPEINGLDVTTFGASAFSSTSITKATLPSSVKHIKYRA